MASPTPAPAPVLAHLAPPQLRLALALQPGQQAAAPVHQGMVERQAGAAEAAHVEDLSLRQGRLLLLLLRALPPTLRCRAALAALAPRALPLGGAAATAATAPRARLSQPLPHLEHRGHLGVLVAVGRGRQA